VVHAVGSIGALLQHPNVFRAGLLVLAAMIFDVLDGSVARWTRQTSSLGGQLDSLSDAISFGVAPAFLVWKLVHLVPAGQAGHIPSRLGWALALLYLCCAVLRLARFNVETAPDDPHEAFRGLPSPGAAGAMVSPFLLFSDQAAYLSHGVCVAILYVLPVWAVAVGALMVSRVPYVHMASWLLKGKKPFTALVEVLFALVVITAAPELALAVGFAGYACTGPVLAAWRWARRPRTIEAARPAPTADWS
jgi:CDP-diacylglycerol--serine O-phosphatidyltransferase